MSERLQQSSHVARPGSDRCTGGDVTTKLLPRSPLASFPRSDRCTGDDFTTGSAPQSLLVARPPWLRRHGLVWIAPEHHASAVAAVSAPNSSAISYADWTCLVRAAAANWLAHGRPVVVRQQASAHIRRAPSAEVAVGIPLPPQAGKLRIAFTVDIAWIEKTAPPPRLCDVIAHAPSYWCAPLNRLMHRVDALGLTLRVFGSLAWQALTGCDYVTRASDVDLLWQPSTRRQLASAIAVLEDWEAETGLRADGEILFGDDDAVAWREWSRVGRQDIGAPHRVLVKALYGSRLHAADELCARLPAPEHESLFSV